MLSHAVSLVVLSARFELSLIFKPTRCGLRHDVFTFDELIGHPDMAQTLSNRNITWYMSNT